MEGSNLGMIKLTDHIFYRPHQPEADRPMLAYLNGERFSLAIDAGYSASHVQAFYQQLQSHNLGLPDFTVLTHWHYDHTFGMHHIQGLSIAHEKTAAFLKKEQEKARDHAYLEQLRKEDPFFAQEYAGVETLNIALPDFTFREELTLYLGGLTARIFHTESPHSEDTVCIYVPEEKVLFLGDATSEDFFNNRYMDLWKLQQLYEMIDRLECDSCILSHSEPLPKNALLDYLHTILRKQD